MSCGIDSASSTRSTPSSDSHQMDKERLIHKTIDLGHNLGLRSSHNFKLTPLYGRWKDSGLGIGQGFFPPSSLLQAASLPRLSAKWSVPFLEGLEDLPILYPFMQTHRHSYSAKLCCKSASQVSVGSSSMHFPCCLLSTFHVSP